MRRDLPPVALVPSVGRGLLLVGAWLVLFGLLPAAAVARAACRGAPPGAGTWLALGAYFLLVGWPLLGARALLRRRPLYTLSVEGVREGPDGELLPWTEVLAVRRGPNGTVRLILRDPARVHARSLAALRRRAPWQARVVAALSALDRGRAEDADFAVDAPRVGCRPAALLALIERYRAAGTPAGPLPPAG